MFFTNLRIEAPSDRPSPMQTMVNAATAVLNGVSFGWSLWAPYRFVQLMYGANRSLTRTLFMV
ncbi:MAG: hypothetical protein K2X44_06335 [Magnetospirillum sp.]|nr:hypothetical protein [Magnetospirillum sp.]